MTTHLPSSQSTADTDAIVARGIQAARAAGSSPQMAASLWYAYLTPAERAIVDRQTVIVKGDYHNHPDCSGCRDETCGECPHAWLCGVRELAA